MVVNKKPSRLNTKHEKWKRPSIKIPIPIVLNCDENLVPLVMNVVGMLSEQSRKPKKTPSAWQHRRPKPVKRFRRRKLDGTEEPVETFRREATLPYPKRKSMLSDKFVHLAAALVHESLVEFPAVHQSLPPSAAPPPSASAALPSTPPKSLSAESQEAAAVATAAAAIEETSHIYSPALPQDVAEDYLPIIGTRVWMGFGWVPSMAPSATGPVESPLFHSFSISEPECIQGLPNSEHVLVQNPQPTALYSTQTVTPSESDNMVIPNDYA